MSLELREGSDGNVEIVVDGAVVDVNSTLSMTAGGFLALVRRYVDASATAAAKRARRTDHRKRVIVRDAEGRIIGLEDAHIDPDGH